MDCKTFQQRLEELDVSLSAAERRDVERHLASCSRCRELDALVRGDLEVFPVEPPVDLTAAILEQTTGTACTRARELLCDFVDASLDEFESRLVHQHVVGCSGCKQIELALTRLASDLPAMARLSPDAAFADDVLAATLPRAERWGRKLKAWADTWQGLLERPRFGLEAGYVGAIGLWALFGLSASPFSDLPQQALAVLQHGPTTGVEKTALAVTELQTHIGEVSRRTWESSARRSVRAVDQWTSGVHLRIERTADARDALRRHGSELGGAALQLDLNQSARAMREIGEGLGLLWREIQAADEANASATTEPPVTTGTHNDLNTDDGQ